VILLLGTYPKERKSGYNRGTCAPMFLAALFTTAKLWKEPSAPQLMNGSRNCGLCTQWSFTQPWGWKKMDATAGHHVKCRIRNTNVFSQTQKIDPKINIYTKSSTITHKLRGRTCW
jgi:hypothetical protein